MSSCAATMPEIPARTIATSSPRRSRGIEPSPAGCAIQSSKGKGKSGPNIVTGRCALSAAEVNSFAMSAADSAQRSEEHTSELQSLRHLVCRLLLEKKKNQRRQDGTTTAND